MNSVVLMGRLVADPETRTTSTGDTSSAISRFKLAVDRRVARDAEQTADFIGCVCFNKTAEFVEKYFRKGMKVAVSGEIRTGSYTNKDGVKVYTQDIVVNNCEFAEGKKENQAAAPETDADGWSTPDIDDGDLPFQAPTR